MKFISNLISTVSQDIGIDLGTANTVVCTRRDGIVLCEPSVVAVKKTSFENNGYCEVLDGGNAVGNSAKLMLDRVPGNVLAIRPLRKGTVTHAEIAEKMIAYFIRKVSKRSWGIKPRLIVSVPRGIEIVYKRAVVDACIQAGAREVYLIEQPLAAALGSNLPISDPSGSMIVDIGGGTTDVAVISLSGIVQHETLPIAGDDFNNAIIDSIRQHYDLLVGEQTAERIKLSVGSVIPLAELNSEEMDLEVCGRCTNSNLPRKVLISSRQVREALVPVAIKMLESIHRVLQQTPPEISADLVHKGITLAGGGAYLRGIDRFFERGTNLPVAVSKEPLYAVARGTAAVTENFDTMIDVLESGADVR